MRKRVEDGSGDLLRYPDKAAIEEIAAELNKAINAKCREMAKEALGHPAVGSDRWMAEIGTVDAERKRRAMKHELLTRIRILMAAHADLDRAVLDARRNGDITWGEIGSACAMTRQAAFGRWGELAKRDAHARKQGAEQIVVDVLAKYPLTESVDD